MTKQCCFGLRVRYRTAGREKGKITQLALFPKERGMIVSKLPLPLPCPMHSLSPEKNINSYILLV